MLNKDDIAFFKEKSLQADRLFYDLSEVANAYSSRNNTILGIGLAVVNLAECWEYGVRPDYKSYEQLRYEVDSIISLYMITDSCASCKLREARLMVDEMLERYIKIEKRENSMRVM